jgi:hypothetical protein
MTRNPRTRNLRPLLAGVIAASGFVLVSACRSES